MAIFRGKEFVRHLAQAGGQHPGDIGAGVFAHDRAHGIDMLVDDRQRDLFQVGRVLQQPAQAVGNRTDGGVAQRAGIALE
jgi:hypothetical protein